MSTLAPPSTPRKLRVMLVHSGYRRSNPSGENRVVELERQLLADQGVDVSDFIVHADQGHPIRQYLSALLAPWNLLIARRFKRHVRALKPDIVHVHNLFPNISPSILPQAHAAGAKVVMTLHNYRWFCSTGTAFRQHAPCYRCQTGQLAWGIRYRCYRGSFAGSLVATAFVASLRRQSRFIDRFLTLSQAQFETLREAGVPTQRMRIKPNFRPTPAQTPLPWTDRTRDAIFIGRLDEEKGVLALLQAWQSMGDRAPALDIIGSGPLENQLREQIDTDKNLSRRIRLHGQLPRADTMNLLSQARLLLMPSLWRETFGLSVLEALASGVGVVALAGSGPDDMIKPQINGQILRLSPDQWAPTLFELFEPDNPTLSRWAAQAPDSINELHEPSHNAAALTALYRELLA